MLYYIWIHLSTYEYAFKYRSILTPSYVKLHKVTREKSLREKNDVHKLVIMFTYHLNFSDRKPKIFKVSMMMIFFRKGSQSFPCVVYFIDVFIEIDVCVEWIFRGFSGLRFIY